MSDQAAQTPPAKKSWFKTIIGTVAGLASGAAVMYVSPLLEKVIKPTKPVANFAADTQGLTVQFHNRSTGMTGGWWDFGDGSPLEPAVPEQDTLTHSYAKPGTYTVKLSARNFLNEETDRSITLNLDSTNVEPPAIAYLEAIPVSQGAFAPATFRVTSKVKNAELAVWDLGNDSPLEFSADPGNDGDRLVTFSQPGGYMIKMAAVNGKQAKEKTEIVYVNEPPANALTAILQVTEQATLVERAERPVMITETYLARTGNAPQLIDRKIPAKMGFDIADARLEPVAGSGGKDLKLKVLGDRKSVQLTGSLMPDDKVEKSAKGAPTLMLKVVLKEEKRTAVNRPAVPVTTTLAGPGSTLLGLPPLPAGWEDVRRQLRLELREGDRIIFQDSQLPRGISVTVQGRRCTLSAMPTGDQVRIDLIEQKAGRISAN